MSEYSVCIGERQYQVSILKDKVLVDNQPVQADLTALNQSGLHMLRREQRMLELYLNEQDVDTCEVLVGSRRMIARVEAGSHRGRATKRQEKAGSLAAPMPGLILSVLVKLGDTVEKGQPLVVMESMKMQMQLRAAVSGKIAAVSAIAGEQVKKGAVLVRIDERCTCTPEPMEEV